MKKVVIGITALAVSVGVYFIVVSKNNVDTKISMNQETLERSDNKDSRKINHGDIVVKNNPVSKSVSSNKERQSSSLNDFERKEAFSAIVSLQSGVALNDKSSAELVQTIAKYGDRLIYEMAAEVMKGNTVNTKAAIAERLSLIDALGKAAKSNNVAKEKLFQFATSKPDFTKEKRVVHLDMVDRLEAYEHLVVADRKQAELHLTSLKNKKLKDLYARHFVLGLKMSGMEEEKAIEFTYNHFIKGV